jgi:hypothetical protein
MTLAWPPRIPLLCDSLKLEEQAFTGFVLEAASD